MKLVVIKWTDAECEESRWSDLDETLEELNQSIEPCITAGFLLKDTPQFLAVTLTDGVTCCGPYIQIPKSCVLEILDWDFNWGKHGQEKPSN